jgi:hypothetical protein
MRAETIPRAIAAGAVIVTAGLVLLLARGPIDEPLPAAAPVERLAVVDFDAPTPRAAIDPPASPFDAQATAKVRELEAMSETYRNTTFLIAIRDSGFICNELLRVYGGLNNSATWTATCSEMLSYTVRVASAGSLHVEPMLQHLDSVPWSPPRESGGEPVPVLPPQRLPPQRR